MLIKKIVAKRLERQTFNQIIVYVLFYCHGIERSLAAEMPHECAFRSFEAETSESTELFCKIRTISGLENLLKNISMKQLDNVVSLHLQCSEILFFESTLTAQTEKSLPGKKASLSKLRDLVIDKCKIRQIPARAFENFKDLKRLHITTDNNKWSAMTMELHEQAFGGLNELIELNLSDNNIWSTHTGTFCTLYSLKTLNLTDNHIQNIKTIGFSDTLEKPNLSIRSCNLVIEVLDMSYNDLIVLSDNGLSKLRSLLKLLLQNNAISTLDNGAFDGLVSLQVLNLSSNFLNTVPPDLFLDLKSLKEINFSNNTIINIPSGLFDGLDQLQILDLSNNKLTSQWINKGTFIGLLRMVILNLSYNNLNKIDRHMFQDLYSLQKLNLEHNEIATIDEHAFEELRNLHSLTLSNNKLVHIHTHLFTDLHVLHELFIDKNRIKQIDENAFDNMTSIEDLGLNDNCLSIVPVAIHKLRSLKSLDIGKNNITHLNRDDFRGLSELYGLRLVDNKVTLLNYDTFQHLSQLQLLNLASNKINHLTLGCFRNNNKLKLLRLDGNEITKFDGILDGLNSLVWLNMSANKISYFDFRSFPKSLEWLDLHENYIKEFVNDDIYSNSNMKVLDLSYNNISEIYETSIPKSVEKLILNDNNIDKIQPGSFMRLQKLSTVTLNNNRLVQLDINAFRLHRVDEGSELPEFFIGGNPFVCDCSMEWIQRINYLSHSRQYPRVLDLDKALCTTVHSRTKEKKIIRDMLPTDFLCSYESHCFALCHCCDFDACDCEMICPNNCRCYHDITWNTNIVDCSNAGYTEVPKRIPMDATEIYLDGNHISHMGNHVFIGKKKLQILYLNNTKLEEVNSQTFKGVHSLKVLHLEENKLVELKGDEFLHLNNLNELYLDHNAIASVANNTFFSLGSLSVLRIDNNKLINFYPWKLLSSSSKTSAHVSIEGNVYSCDCKSIAELDFWLRRDPGDPEKILCTGTEGNPTKITIASVLSHCKEYMGSMDDPTVSRNEIMSKSMFLSENYVIVICVIVIVVVVICLTCMTFYAFRYKLSDWLYTKCGVPMFKEQSCQNVDLMLDSLSNQMYDYYVIYNTKDSSFVYDNIMSELEFRKMISQKNFSNENSLNILKLDNFSKSTKLSKRLIIVLTANFIYNDLCDVHFNNIFFSYLKTLNHGDFNKVLFIKIADNNQLSEELCFVLDNFKNISWYDPYFWDKFVAVLNSTDTIITLKDSETSVFKKSSRQSPALRYMTMPVPNDSCSKQNFSSSMQYYKKNDGESSQNESSPSSDSNTYREGHNSNNSYMSIDNTPCRRFNYDLKLSPGTGHVYSGTDNISLTTPRFNTGRTSNKGRTYYV